MYQYLSIPDPNSLQNGHHALAYFGPKWWFTLHMIQTPLVGLVAIGLWLMMEGIEDADGLAANIFAWLARISTFVFLIYYTVLDSIAGIGLGRTMVLVTKDTTTWTPEKVEVVQQLLNKVWGDGWVGGTGSVISLTGSWAIFFAALFAAIALLLTKKVPWPPLLILIAFGWELQRGHPSYDGPIAFSLLIISATWIYFKSDVMNNKNETDWTIKHLKEHLQAAVDLEFWTIPFYMSAMYSIKDRNLPAYQMLRTVVNQEMLHLQCAANIANAYGLSPTIHDPPYEGQKIPHLKFPKQEVEEYEPYTAEIGPLNEEHINAMCLIEHPEENPELQELKIHLKKYGTRDLQDNLNNHLEKYNKTDLKDYLKTDIKDYPSIGAFYNALRVGAHVYQDLIQGGVKQVDYFSAFYRNMPNMTITESGAAGFNQVNLLIDLIIDQGEGDPDHEYYNDKGHSDEGEIPSAFQNIADDTKPKDDHFAKFTQIKGNGGVQGQKLPNTYIVEEPRNYTEEQKQLEENLIEQFRLLMKLLDQLFKGDHQLLEDDKHNPENFFSTMASVGGAIKNCWLNGVTPKYSLETAKSESIIYSWAMSRPVNLAGELES